AEPHAREVAERKWQPEIVRQRTRQCLVVGLLEKTLSRRTLLQHREVRRVPKLVLPPGEIEHPPERARRAIDRGVRQMFFLLLFLESAHLLGFDLRDAVAGEIVVQPADGIRRRLPFPVALQGAATLSLVAGEE